MPASSDASSPPAALDITDDRLLGGRVRYAQPRHGFRSGLEPVLLAAAVPARAGERVLEAGSGAGAALLCLAARVPMVTGMGIERDAALAALAGENAATNGWSELTFVATDVERAENLGVFDHAFANPPYHAASGTASPDPARDTAKRADPSLLTDWVRVMAFALRHRGTLTLILPAAALPAAIGAMAGAQCPADVVFPLWPKPGRAAKLALIQGVKNGRGAMRLLSGLTLHTEGGEFTEEAEAVLRSASPIPLRRGRA
jgi:tRNA1(Val) A37 N6-methylase TrmN6